MSLHLRSLVAGLFSAAHVRHVAYWGDCEQCERTTPWYVNAVRGTYRCTACGGSPRSR